MIIDSSTLALASLADGLVGATHHGAPDRWDWSVTLETLQRAQDRHRRMQAIADGLTPEQRALAWGADTQQARELRRFMR